MLEGKAHDLEPLAQPDHSGLDYGLLFHVVSGYGGHFKALRVPCKHRRAQHRWQGGEKGIKEGCESGNSSCWVQPREAPGATTSTFKPHCCFAFQNTTAAGQAQLTATAHSRSGRIALQGPVPGLGLAPLGREGHLVPGLLLWEKRGLFPPARVARSRAGRAALEMAVPTFGKVRGSRQVRMPAPGHC